MTNLHYVNRMSDTSRNGTEPDPPPFDEFHNGDKEQPLRVEFSSCRLACGIVCRLAMVSPDDGRLFVKWFEDVGVANLERYHLEDIGYKFVRQDSFRAF